MIDYSETQIAKFVNALTPKIFAQFYYAIEARAQLEPQLLDGTDGLSKSEIEYIRNGRSILAIKEYRQRTGTSLKEAKDFIDAKKNNFLRSTLG